MVRRHHVVFSIFLAHGDAQVPLTLTQRVMVRGEGAILGLLCYASMSLLSPAVFQ